MKALIFDVDGTLAETEELHRQAFNDAFAQFGLGWHWSQEDYRALLKTTGGKERMRAFANSIDAALDDAQIRDIHIWKTARYGDLLGRGALELRPGIKDLIQFARTYHLKTAIATTTNLPNVDALAHATFSKPASEIFDAIAAGDMVAHKKPAPDVYELALAKLNLPASQCLAFEDTLNGVKSAQGAGIAVVLSHGFYSKDEPDGGAEFVVGEFDAALALAPFRKLADEHAHI